MIWQIALTIVVISYPVMKIADLEFFKFEKTDEYDSWLMRTPDTALTAYWFAWCGFYGGIITAIIALIWWM